MSRNVFVNGATGFVGSHLVPALVLRGHRVNAGVRENSVSKLPAGVEVVVCDALRAETYEPALASCDTFVQLVGVAHPSPAKAEQFKTVDLESCRQAVRAVAAAKIPHFVYVSVAQPSPVMKAYVSVRQECERLIGEAGLNASIVRPFYILGPGRRWPLLLRPFFAIAEKLPATRETAQRITFITIAQMVGALVSAIENPPRGVRVWPAADIKKFGEAFGGGATS